MSDSEGGVCSSPDIGTESRGSSVSTVLREEYEDLLRYAVVTPVLDSRLTSKGQSLAKNQSSQHYPSPPRPHTPPPHASRGHLQPEVSKIASDISDPSDLQQEPDNQATPLLRPPPPFTAMNVQQHETTPSAVSSFLEGSHDLRPQSHDNSVESHDQSVDNIVRSHDVDPEMTRLESQLDGWCLDLKRNILAEFEQSRIRMLERRQAELERERKQHNYDLQEANAQLEQYKELLVTYEQSIGRKDHVIANLTKALQKQKDRVELQRTFGSWKLRHSDEQRESFTTTLARQHYHRKVKGRIWEAWFGLIQARWKQRVEKACQSKAEQVCVQLTGDYEEQLEAVHRSLEESQEEVRQLKAERDLYEENMKKAFMRGVCALNMEAMSMFRYHEPDNSHHGDESSNHGDGHGNNAQQPNSDPQIASQGIAPPHIDQTLRHSAPVPSRPPTKSIRVTTTASHTARGPTSQSQLNPSHVNSRRSHAHKQERGVANMPHKHRPEVVVQKH